MNVVAVLVELVAEQLGHGGLAADARAAGQVAPLAEDVLADEDEPERHDREVEPAQPGGQRCDEHPGEGGDQPAAGSQTRMFVIPKPIVRPSGSPQIAAAV